MVTAVKSFSNAEKSYELTINEQTGEATNCQCPAKHFNPKVPCKHMRQFNVEVQCAAAFILVQRQVREMEYTWKANREMAFNAY